MSAPMVPHRFVDSSNLDVEKINDNLEAIARDVNRNLSKRYTHSQLVWDFSGVTNASAEVLRQFAVRRPGANSGVEIVGVEVVTYGNAAVTMSVTCSDSSWPTMEVTTSATTTTEVHAQSNHAVSVPSSASDVTFTLSWSGAYTVTNGYLVVHLRCDRGNQGSAHADYTPTLVDSSSSTAGALLDTQLQAAETAVSADTANDADLRCECAVARSLGAGSALVWRLPSGARRIAKITAYVVQAAAGPNSVDFDVASATTDAINANAAGGGATTRVVETGTPGADAVMVDDPTDSADDMTVTITANGATADLAYCLVWWS